MAGTKNGDIQPNHEIPQEPRVLDSALGEFARSVHHAILHRMLPPQYSPTPNERITLSAYSSDKVIPHFRLSRSTTNSLQVAELAITTGEKRYNEYLVRVMRSWVQEGTISPLENDQAYDYFESILAALKESQPVIPETKSMIKGGIISRLLRRNRNES
jgi:hypothetical protein